MNTRKIGDLEVSAIGLGCMGMSHAYGTPPDKNEMINLIYKAIDMGYNFFDTAEVYGTEENPHDNEELVGTALKNCRDKVIIATKFGLTFDTSAGKVPYPLIANSKPENIIKAVEGSLKRLQTDHIDLYYQHRTDPAVPVEEVAEVMAKLIKEGKILRWGLSEADEEHIRRADKICKLTAIQNRYSMMYRDYEALFSTLEELDIGFVAFSPLANGLLSGKYDKNTVFNEKGDYRSAMPQFKPEAFDENKKLFELINDLAERNNATVAQVSLAWMLNKKPYIVPIPGTRKLDRLKENFEATTIKITKEEVENIDKALNDMTMSSVFGRK